MPNILKTQCFDCLTHILVRPLSDGLACRNEHMEKRNGEILRIKGEL